MTTHLRSTPLRRVDWGEATLPGAACGATRPIRLHHAKAVMHSAARPWLPGVVAKVYPSGVVYGDLDGDGRDEAAVSVGCSTTGNGSGTGLFNSTVIFTAHRHTLPTLGVITAQQPGVTGAQGPWVWVGKGGIHRGEIVATEGWAGLCCITGIARSVWKYTHGRLRPGGTKVLRHAWASPMVPFDATFYPNDVDLDPNQPAELALYPHTELDVNYENLGPDIRHTATLTLTIHGDNATLVRTTALHKTDPSDPGPTEATFRLAASAIPRGRTTVTLTLHVPGAIPLHYPVVVTSG